MKIKEVHIDVYNRTAFSMVSLWSKGNSGIIRKDTATAALGADALDADQNSLPEVLEQAARAMISGYADQWAKELSVDEDAVREALLEWNGALSFTEHD